MDARVIDDEGTDATVAQFNTKFICELTGEETALCLLLPTMRR